MDAKHRVAVLLTLTAVVAPLSVSPAIAASAREAHGSAARTGVKILNATGFRGGRGKPRPAPRPRPTSPPTSAPSTPAPITPTPSPTTADPLSSTNLSKSRISAGEVGGVWFASGASPSDATVVANAAKYDVIILNAWDLAALRRIRQANPRAIVLVYKCLASTRSYAGAVDAGKEATFLPTGVGYMESKTPWFATGTDGQRIGWGPYPGHWQMATWNPEYRNAWVRNVTREIAAGGWDGVLADNDMATLGWYSDKMVAGTTSRSQTDALLRTGLDDLVAQAGSALNKQGKLLVPNLSDGRVDLPRWKRASAHGGTMEENFVHWGTDANTGHLSDWGPTGWVDQTAQLAAPLTISSTRAAPGDTRSLRYGYASALVRAQGRVVWVGDTSGVHKDPNWFAWQSIQLGAPREVGTATSTGAWIRPFAKGIVVVNPTQSPVTLALPKGYSKTSVSVGALDAAIIQ